MAEPEADCGDVDEAQETFGGFVVACRDTAGVFELAEAPLTHVALPVEFVIDTHAHFACLSHWDLSEDVAFVRVFPNMVSIIAPICQ